MNRSAISTATLSKPPGIAPEIDHQDPHPLAGQCGDGLVDLVGGGLLKAGELEIADPVGRVDNSDLGDAFDVDVAADQAKRLDRAVAAA